VTATTARLRESSVVIVECVIPEGMTIAEYRRSRHESSKRRPRRALGIRRKRATHATRA
jgi:hypothetical protein